MAGLGSEYDDSVNFNSFEGPAPFSSAGLTGMMQSSADPRKVDMLRRPPIIQDCEIKDFFILFLDLTLTIFETVLTRRPRRQRCTQT